MTLATTEEGPQLDVLLKVPVNLRSEQSGARTASTKVYDLPEAQLCSEKVTQLLSLVSLPLSHGKQQQTGQSDRADGRVAG